jgi:hypothetical protein
LGRSFEDFGLRDDFGFGGLGDVSACKAPSRLRSCTGSASAIERRRTFFEVTHRRNIRDDVFGSK